MKYRKKRMNDQGVLDIPFKIIIMIIMIGSVIPLGLMNYRNISRENFKLKIENELENLCFSAREISMLGNLSSKKVGLDLEGNIFADIDYVKIRNESGKDEEIIEYRFKWEKSPHYISHDDVSIYPKTDNTITLHGGTHHLVLTHLKSPGKSAVLVSLN
ncbi:MAG: hypothetical protein ACLFVB_01770 [Thermoplasmata archaeon]